MMAAAKISRVSSLQVAIVAVIFAATAVLADDNDPIPAAKDQVEHWFTKNVQPLEARKDTLDAALVAAEASPKTITVSQDGKGDFKTITDAINSVPLKNDKRVIIKIAGGTYNEKITIDRTKDFITLLGDPKNMPNLTYNGDAARYGTVDSATLVSNTHYFVAANIIFSNSSPNPNGRLQGGQAVAIRVSGNNSALYNCVLLGFQDTLCDDRGHHLYKDCTIQGTIDFIFGRGTSLYLNNKIVVVGNVGGVIVANARDFDDEPVGFSFVHCDVTGTANGTFLGRAWFPHGRAVFSYTNISNIINPLGWNLNNHPAATKTVKFEEYQNTGESGDPKERAPFTKILSEPDAKQFLNLGFIEGSRWLLPPPRY